jgi:hypothetical protein
MSPKQAAAQWSGCGRRGRRRRCRSAHSPRCCRARYRRRLRGRRGAARAHARCSRRAGRGAASVLCVGDGHVLDDASAALVHQLVAAGEAFAVVTLRRGEPVADALFLREMVHYGLERGDLTDEGRVWRWRGEMVAGLRLVELIGARLGALETHERSALEVIAVGAPLEIALLDADETAALDALEQHEVVEGRGDGRRRVVDVAHPLHSEVVRSRLSRTRLEAIQRRLADAVDARGARRRGDLLRLAAWQLEAGAARERRCGRGIRRPADARAVARRPPRRGGGAVRAPGTTGHDGLRAGGCSDWTSQQPVLRARPPGRRRRGAAPCRAADRRPRPARRRPRRTRLAAVRARATAVGARGRAPAAELRRHARAGPRPSRDGDRDRPRDAGRHGRGDLGGRGDRTRGAGAS